jgi:hypothetical protein
MKKAFTILAEKDPPVKGILLLGENFGVLLENFGN